MSSAFIMATIWIGKGRVPDWKAAETAISEMTYGSEEERGPGEAGGPIFDAIDSFQADNNPTEEQTDAYLREILLDNLRELRSALEGDDGEPLQSVDYSEFGDYRVYVTGGHSFGDSPTELFDVIALLNDSGALRKAGFYQEVVRDDVVYFTPDAIRSSIREHHPELVEQLGQVSDGVLSMCASEELVARNDFWPLFREMVELIAREAITRHGEA